MDLSVGTFNLNNLFDRFNFEASIDELPKKDREVESTVTFTFTESPAGEEPSSPTRRLAGEDAPGEELVRFQKYRGRLIKEKPLAQRQAIGKRILAMDVDVLAVQEVEHIAALRAFNKAFLGNRYPYRVLVEGNDPRFIDVGSSPGTRC